MREGVIGREFLHVGFAALYAELESELERLQLQARCLEGLTRRLIRESGIRAGMRVLDLGSVPETSPSWSPRRSDRRDLSSASTGSERSVDLARRRAAEAGYGNVAFAVAGDDSLPADAPFDAAIGRLVLIHQRDPADPPGGGRRPAGRRGRLSRAGSSPRWPLSSGGRAHARGGRKSQALHARRAAEPRRRWPDDPLLHGGGAARAEGAYGSRSCQARKTTSGCAPSCSPTKPSCRSMREVRNGRPQRRRSRDARRAGHG